MTAHKRKNTLLISLFDELVRKRPDILDEIPDGAVLVMQLEGNEVFNLWARKIAEANAAGRPTVFVKFSLKARTPRTATLSWKHIKEMELQPLAA